MDKERKDELGNLFLLKKETPIDELKKLEIQEINFLIYSVKYFKENKAFLNDNFDEKIQIFFSVLKDKIKDAEELYIAYNKNTNYPHIDANDRIWIFSKEEYAKKAEDYFLQQLVMLEAKKVIKEEIIKEFAKLHNLGMEKIIVDNGEYATEINRDEILPPPDWSNTPKISIPVSNPKLQYAMIQFFQELYSQNNYEGKKQVLQKLENKMLDEVISSKYLIPMQLKEEEPSNINEQGISKINKGATMEFPGLVREDNTNWLPAFTDWQEFEKSYDKNIWKGNISTYDDLLGLSIKMDGIVINCKGISFTINDKNKRMIEEYKEEKANLKECTVEKGTKIMLGEPKDYPAKMIEVVKEHMKKDKRVKKAYLRLMIKDNEKSYLMVVDFNGKKEEVFKGIADVAIPNLNGMFLDMVRTGDDWVKDAVNGVEPFYKKKVLGIF